MAIGFHENAQLKAVYFDKGRFPFNDSKKRYLRAPFDHVLMEDGESGTYDHFVQPKTAIFESTSEDVAGREIGFETLEHIVIGENEMGSVVASSDNDNDGAWHNMFELHFV